MASEAFITFDEAVDILKSELHYPADRALHYVKRFDKNNDGRLSTSEFNAFKEKINHTRETLVPKFKEYDADGNGFITLAEASNILQSPPFSFPPGKVVMLLKKFDCDGNGKLDIEEFAGFYAEAKATHEEMSSRFDQLDTDKNGVLSPEEIQHVIQDFMGFDEHTVQWMIKMFDQNQDGNLDKCEFMDMWTSMFG